jgi:hypothetical protein
MYLIILTVLICCRAMSRNERVQFTLSTCCRGNGGRWPVIEASTTDRNCTPQSTANYIRHVGWNTYVDIGHQNFFAWRVQGAYWWSVYRDHPLKCQLISRQRRSNDVDQKHNNNDKSVRVHGELLQQCKRNLPLWLAVRNAAAPVLLTLIYAFFLAFSRAECTHSFDMTDSKHCFKYISVLHVQHLT